MAKISNKMKIKNADGTFEDIQISYIGQNGTTAEGIGTVATAKGQHVQGKYNIEDIEKKYAHIVGNGEENIPSNAHTLDWDGNAWFAGNITAGEKNLTVKHEGKTITWDGVTDGLTKVSNNYKVSDIVPTYEQLKDGVTIRITNSDNTITEFVSSNMMTLHTQNGYFYFYLDGYGSRVYIYTEGNTSRYSPGIYFFKSSVTTEYVSYLSFENSTELNLDESGVTAGAYGGLISSTSGYNVPKITIDKYGRVEYISNSIIGPVSSKSSTSLGLVTYDQINPIGCASGWMYWAGPNGSISIYNNNLGKIKIDTISYVENGVTTTSYLSRVIDVQLYVFTTATATERSWVPVKWRDNTSVDAMSSTGTPSTSLYAESPSEYWEYNVGKNIDGTANTNDTMGSVLYRVLFEVDPTKTVSGM